MRAMKKTFVFLCMHLGLASLMTVFGCDKEPSDTTNEIEKDSEIDESNGSDNTEENFDIEIRPQTGGSTDPEHEFEIRSTNLDEGFQNVFTGIAVDELIGSWIAEYEDGTTRYTFLEDGMMSTFSDWDGETDLDQGTWALNGNMFSSIEYEEDDAYEYYEDEFDISEPTIVEYSCLDQGVSSAAIVDDELFLDVIVKTSVGDTKTDGVWSYYTRFREEELIDNEPEGYDEYSSVYINIDGNQLRMAVEMRKIDDWYVYYVGNMPELTGEHIVFKAEASGTVRVDGQKIFYTIDTANPGELNLFTCSHWWNYGTNMVDDSDEETLQRYANDQGEFLLGYQISGNVIIPVYDITEPLGQGLTKVQ